MKIYDKNVKKVFIMPKVEEKILNRAKKSELKVLYYVFSNNGEFDVKTASVLLEETEETINSALAFWRGTGVISDFDETNDENTEKTKEEPSDETKKTNTACDEARSAGENNGGSEHQSSKEAPSSYTLLEIASARDRNAEFASLIDYLEKLTGKMYNSAEQGIILYLYDTLGINYEFIMGVANYCVSKGKSSVRYIQKTVMSIHDEGINTYSELDIYLSEQKSKEDYRTKVRHIIGVDRAFTKQECSVINHWEKKNYPFELVNLAYEKTVAAINKPQITYMGKILDSWYEKNLNTVAQVEEFSKNNPVRQTNTSNDGRLEFNLDDIFEKPM